MNTDYFDKRVREFLALGEKDDKKPQKATSTSRWRDLAARHLHTTKVYTFSDSEWKTRSLESVQRTMTQAQRAEAHKNIKGRLQGKKNRRIA